MTGFAAASAEDGGWQVRATLKSVNHRFLDIAVKGPAMLAGFEARVRALIQERVTRGRVEASLWVESTDRGGRDVVLDIPLLQRIADEIESARAQGLVAGELSASDVLRMPDVLAIRPRVFDSTSDGIPSGLAPVAERVVRDAADTLVEMRETEGEFLARDLDARLRLIGAHAADLERLGREGQAQLDARLRERIAALPPDIAGDPAAVAQEIVRVVARSDVDEEIVRIRGHIEHWRQLAQGMEACGRKLDFLVQELLREINTIGSKVEGTRATEAVIAAKVELERMREQVQNVE
jgi:uncharacterized protein (TIGR00255 family)